MYVEKFIQLHEPSENSLIKYINKFGILNKWNDFFWYNQLVYIGWVCHILLASGWLYDCELDQGFTWLWEISGILVNSPCLHCYQLPCQLLLSNYIFRFETLTKIPYHQSDDKRWRNLWEQVKPSEKQCNGTISDSSILFYIVTPACRLCLSPPWTYCISQHWKGVDTRTWASSFSLYYHIALHRK